MNCQIILFVDSSMIGGIETHIVELHKLLSKNNVSCSVLFYKNHGNNDFYTLLDKQSIRYDFLQGTPSSLIKQLRRYDDNTVIHTHGYKAGILGRLACKLTHKHCISTYHAGDAGTGKMWLYNKLDLWLSCLSTNFAVSEQISKTIKNATLLENFIDIKEPPTVNFFSSPLRIGFVGRLSYEKAPDIFYTLAESMQNSNNVMFHLFGDGPMRNTIPQLENLHYHGLTNRDDIWHQIDVLLICSREEGLPMTLLESMAHHKIVISSPVGAIPSIIKNNTNGLLMKTGDAQECQNCINALLIQSPDQKSAMAQAAYAMLKERFSGKNQFLLLQNAYTAKSRLRL